MNAKQIVSVIDIGSTKVSCCIANIFENNQFNIISAGSCVCYGVKAGIIVDIDSVTKSIAKAVEMAENAVNLRIKSVYVNISGRYVQSKIVSTKLNIGGRLVKHQDITNILLNCRDRNHNMETIHVVPIMFGLDDLIGITEPIGMFANILKVDANVVSISKSQLSNILVCLSKCHLDVLGFVHSGYASGLCMLDDYLSESNQIVIDFGGGETSVNFFYKGIFCGSESIPIGSKNITKDISYGLHVSFNNAERLKTLYGAAFASHDDNKESIMIPVIDEDDVVSLSQLSKIELNRIIQPRVEEILNFIKEKINNSVFSKNFTKNIIITGGGSMLTGMREFTSEFLKMNIKTRKIDDYLDNSGIQINNEFATSLGMIKFAMSIEENSINHKQDFKRDKKESFFKKTINWLENNL